MTRTDAQSAKTTKYVNKALQEYKRKETLYHSSVSSGAAGMHTLNRHCQAGGEVGV